jgi:hypothetical protein
MHRGREQKQATVWKRPGAEFSERGLVSLGLGDEYDAPEGILACAIADRQVAAGGTCTSYLFEFPIPPRYNYGFMCAMK